MSTVFNIDDEYGQGQFDPNFVTEVVQFVEDEEGLGTFGLPGEMPLPDELMVDEPFNFFENLAETADPQDLASLASNLLKEISDDASSRREADQTAAIGLKYLGLKLEEFRTDPFINACAAYDSTLMTALVRSYATAQAELFPPKGPVSTKIIGPKNEQAEQKAEDLKTFGNYYLTEVDKPYYEDSQRLLLHSILYGTAYRKIYQDPVLNRPVARLVKAQDLLRDPNA